MHSTTYIFINVRTIRISVDFIRRIQRNFQYFAIQIQKYILYMQDMNEIHRRQKLKVTFSARWRRKNFHFFEL